MENRWLVIDGGTPNSGVELFVKESCDFTQIYDLSFESSSCLTGMPAAKLQQHLSNMNVMFNRWIAFGWCEEKGEYDEFGIVIWFSNRHSSHTIGEMSLSVLKMYRNIYDRNMSYNYHITLCRFVVSYFGMVLFDQGLLHRHSSNDAIAGKSIKNPEYISWVP